MTFKRNHGTTAGALACRVGICLSAFALAVALSVAVVEAVALWA